MARVVPFFLSFVVLITSCTTPFSGTTRSFSAREAHLRQQGYSSQKIEQQWGDQRFWTKVYIAGSPAKLLLDSGANSTDINESFAAKKKLPALANVSVISKGALGREMTSNLTIASLKLGSQYVPEFPFVMSARQEGKSAVSAFDGQLGLDAFYHTAALLDLEGKKLWTPHHQKGPPLIPSQLGALTLKLKKAKNYPHLILEGRVKGRMMRWIVDSGAEVSLLDLGVARSMGLNIVSTQSKMIDVAGDSSALSVTVIPKQAFGDFTVFGMPCAVASLDLIRRSFVLKGKAKVDGILGVDFLRSSKALLDPRRELIYIGQPAHSTGVALVR